MSTGMYKYIYRSYQSLKIKESFEKIVCDDGGADFWRTKVISWKSQKIFQILPKTKVETEQISLLPLLLVEFARLVLDTAKRCS